MEKSNGRGFVLREKIVDHIKDMATSFRGLPFSWQVSIIVLGVIVLHSLLH